MQPPTQATAAPHKPRNGWPAGAMLLAAVAALALGPVLPAQADQPGDNSSVSTIVGTDRGPVHGVAHEGYRTFEGIPFAAPPVAALRWRAPQPVPPWPGVRDATTPGSRCLQSTERPNLVGIAEDCLYLNVTTPNGHTTGARPVIVWLHGGHFAEGSGSDYLTHRMALAGDAVVVTVNYRLGIFGYFGHPALAGSGTFGLEDQLAALRWVRRNAAAFGGDPGNVTLAGQSAGAMSACSLLTAPAATGLFAKVILHSGSCQANYPNNARAPGERADSPWAPRAQVEAAGQRTATALGCGTVGDTLACLRAQPASDLLTHTAEFLHLAYNTPLLPREPAAALRDGQANPLPVLAGSNRDEHRLWAQAFYRNDQPISAVEYHALLTDAFGPAAGRVEDHYPLHAYQDNTALAWTTIVTDRAWACPIAAANQLLAARAPVYGYEFADRDAFPLYLPPAGFPTGAYHSAELSYVFNFRGFDPPSTPLQQDLARQMITYWTQFARTSNPNSPGQPHWPRLHPHQPRTLSLAPGHHGIRPVDLPAEHQCHVF